MSSPPKRRRTADTRDHPQDPDRTPRQPQHRQLLSQGANDGDVFDPPRAQVSSADSSSAYRTVLEHRPVFSLPPTEPSSPSILQSRSSSPSKQYQKTASLLNLVRPVRFVKVDSLKKALPNEMPTLLEALLAVSAGEEILPAVLRGHSDFDDETIRRSMWQSTDASSEPSPETEAAVLRNHTRLQGIKDNSLSSFNLQRSEAAWNCRVHDPLLCHLTSAFPFVEVEPITSARIEPPFRPLSKNAPGGKIPSISSSSSASRDLSETPPTRRGPAASSVHKMVDFALVLRPDEELERLIDAFLSTQPLGSDTINQTRYEPLRCRPAPVFIETKTISGSLDVANVQLGVWVAAWYERLRGIMAIKDINEKIITIPVIQVMDDVWTVLFAVDAGPEITLLHRNLRIGDTSTIFGVYQMQAAISALATWMKDVFEPWMTDLLRRVLDPETR